MYIGDIGAIITGKTPSTKIAEYWDGTIPFVTPKDLLKTKHIVSTERSITRNGLNAIKSAILPENAVCVSCIGNIGYVGMTTQICASNQQINTIVVNDKNDPDYIFYLIKSLRPFFKNYEGQSTALSIMNKTQFSKIEVEIPSLDVQRRIAKILSQLDSKIENNNMINDNLLLQAETIFRTWFCNSSHNDNLTPASWENATIGELTSFVARGITPIYDNNTDQVILNQKCIRNHIIDFTPARRHSPKAITDKWLMQGDLLINSTGEGTLGRVAQVWFNPHNITVDSHITIVRPKTSLLQYYIGFWGLTHEAAIESLHTGSTGQTELPRDRLKSLSVLLPDDDTLMKFNKIVTPITHTIVAKQKESCRLAILRDTLLPKLMSGEIDVSAIDT